MKTLTTSRRAAERIARQRRDERTAPKEKMQRVTVAGGCVRVPLRSLTPSGALFDGTAGHYALSFRLSAGNVTDVVIWRETVTSSAVAATPNTIIYVRLAGRQYPSPRTSRTGTGGLSHHLLDRKFLPSFTRLRFVSNCSRAHSLTFHAHKNAQTFLRSPSHVLLALYYYYIPTGII